MVVFGYDWLQMVGSGCLHSYFSLSLVVFGCLWVPLVVNGFNLHLWSFFGDNCVIILCLFICFENQNAKSFQFFLSDCQSVFLTLLHLVCTIVHALVALLQNSC